MRKGETFAHHCLKCSYDWTGRKASPTECPRCKNRRWAVGGEGKISGATPFTPKAGAAKPGPAQPPPNAREMRPGRTTGGGHTDKAEGACTRRTPGAAPDSLGSSMVEPLSRKQQTGVRFPTPAPRPVLGCLCPPDDVKRGKHHKYCPYAEE